MDMDGYAAISAIRVRVRVRVRVRKWEVASVRCGDATSYATPCTHTVLAV